MHLFIYFIHTIYSNKIIHLGFLQEEWLVSNDPSTLVPEILEILKFLPSKTPIFN